MAKQKYYAYFFDEKNNGIVDTWSECEKIVHGTKARYKSFIDKSVAQDWLDSGANYERNISLKTPVNTTLEKGIYFDSGTGRGIGVEVRVTDENKENILDKISPNSLEELLKCNLILGDSRLVIDYWSLGRFHENNLELETINYINKVIQLRKEFEKNKGIVRHISGDVNPADLGFHK